MTIGKAISVPYEVFRENGHFVAYCIPLDLAVQGKTFEEVKERFKKLIPLFINDLEKRGTLEDVLFELGWEKITKKWVAPVKVADEIGEVKIPCPA